jgi:hypothetical protein
LSDEQKNNICLYLSAGCDREAAAKLAHCSHWELHSAMTRDTAFAEKARHAEGASELAHVRNVQNAAQDVKNWRASVWWLERRSPERFGRRDAGTVTTRQLKAFVAQLVAIVIEELHDAGDRQRIVDRFDELIKTLDQLIFDDSNGPGETSGSASSKPREQTNLDNADPMSDDETELDELE